MSMRPQIPVRSSESEQALQFIRQMGEISRFVRSTAILFPE